LEKEDKESFEKDLKIEDEVNGRLEND